MRSKSQVAKRIAAACVVAAGIAVLWVVGITWLLMIVRLILPSQGGTYEGVQTALDGTTVINTYASGGNSQLVVGRRTLDGKPWPLEYDEWLQPAYIQPPFEPAGIVELPLSWNEGYGRTAGTTDGKLVPTAWYLVLDDERLGTVYAAGFDDVSKKLVGYMGRNGFYAAKPPVAEQFVTPRNENGFEYLTIGPYLEQRRLVDNRQIFGNNSAQWTIYLLGIDRLWEIDLRQRTAKPHGKFEGATSIGQLSVNRATFEQIAALNAKDRAEFGMVQLENAKEKTAEEKETEESAKKSHTASLVAVREADRLILFDLQGTRRIVFNLPEQIRKRPFSAQLIKPDQLMIVLHEKYGEYWNGGPIHRLYWINPQGFHQRRKTRLGRWRRLCRNRLSLFSDLCSGHRYGWCKSISCPTSRARWLMWQMRLARRSSLC
jgi:hypothetical protein